jgi:hypothetical protein
VGRSRSARWGGWLLASTIALAGNARATLVLDAEGRLGATPALELGVTNAGAAPLDDVTPEVLFVRRTATGAAVDLAPGERRGWTLPLATPDGPGEFPAIVRVRARSAGERTDTVLVATVATPGVGAGGLDARLLVSPIAGSGGAELLLENRTDRHIAGRVALVAPAALTPQPETQPAAVPAAGLTRVVFVLQDTGMPSDTPRLLFGMLEYELDGVHHTALARAEADVVPGGRARRRLPLVVGLTALGMCLALLGIAVRRAALRQPHEGPGRPESTRA